MSGLLRVVQHCDAAYLAQFLQSVEAYASIREAIHADCKVITTLPEVQRLLVGRDPIAPGQQHKPLTSTLLLPQLVSHCCPHSCYKPFSCFETQKTRFEWGFSFRAYSTRPKTYVGFVSAMFIQPFVWLAMTVYPPLMDNPPSSLTPPPTPRLRLITYTIVDVSLSVCCILLPYASREEVVVLLVVALALLTSQCSQFLNMVSLELKTSVGTGFFLNGDHAETSVFDEPELHTPRGGDTKDRPEIKRRTMSDDSNEGSKCEGGERRASDHLRKMFQEVRGAGQSSTRNLLFLAGFGASPSGTPRTTPMKTSPRGDSKGRKSCSREREDSTESAKADLSQKGAPSRKSRAKSEPQQSLQSCSDELLAELEPEKSAPAELRSGRAGEEKRTEFEGPSKGHIEASDDESRRVSHLSSRVSFEEIRFPAVASVSAVCQSHACQWYERTRARAKAQPPRRSIDRASSIARVYAAEADAAKQEGAKKAIDRRSMSFKCRVLLLSSIRWFRAEPLRIADACATAAAAGLFGCILLDEQRWPINAQHTSSLEVGSGELQGKRDFSIWMALTALLMVLKQARLLASFQEFGPLLLILKRICLDIARFFFLFGIVLLSFAAGLHLLYVESDDQVECEGHHSFDTYGSVLSLLLEFSVNMQSEFDCVSEFKHRGLAKGILVMFTVISALLLANMLIASMTKTFDDVYEGVPGRLLRTLAWMTSACHLPPAACRLPPAACRLPPAACRLMNPLRDSWVRPLVWQRKSRTLRSTERVT